MIKKLTLVLGFGAGYVLGAKAGTERYEQIVAKAREVAGMPAVQEVTNNLATTASTLADTAKTKANDTISSVASTPPPATSTAPETVDLTTGSTTSGYATGAVPPVVPATGTVPASSTAPPVFPVTGAAPSDTV